MPVIETKAYILKTADFSEQKAYLTLLTPTLGKIDVLQASGRHRIQNNLKSTEYFSLSQFLLFEHRGRYRLNQATLVAGFQAAKSDVEGLTCLAHLSDVLMVATTPDTAQKLYELICYASYAVDQCLDQKKTDQLMLMMRLFELRVLALSGYPIPEAQCTHCCQPISPQAPLRYFDLEACAWICTQPGCLAAINQGADESILVHQMTPTMKRGDRILAIGSDTYRAVMYAQQCPIQRLFSFKGSITVIEELNRLLTPYLAERFERPFTKLDYLVTMHQFSYR